jgi:hypothetical protein
VGNALDRVKVALRAVIADAPDDVEKVAQTIAEIAAAIRWATGAMDDEDRDNPAGRVSDALLGLGSELQEFVFEVLGDERAKQLRHEWLIRLRDRGRPGQISGN